MNQDSQFDVFIHKSDRYRRCVKHNKKLALICTNPKCEVSNLLCVHCIITEHSDCRKFIINRQEFENNVQERMLNIQKIKAKQLKGIEERFLRLQSARTQLNHLLYSILQSLDSGLEEIEQFINCQTISNLVKCTSQEDEAKLIKQLVEDQSKSSLLDQILQKYENQQQNEFNLTGDLESIVKKYNYLLLNSNRSQNKNKNERTVKVTTLDDLDYYDSSIKKLRIELDIDQIDRNVDFSKFFQLFALQIGLARTQLSAIEINNIIKSIKTLGSLKKLHLNLIGTNSDTSTLVNLFSTINYLKLDELGISIDFTQITEEQLIEIIKLNLKGIQKLKKFIISNKYKQFEQNKICALSSNIELAKCEEYQ